MPLFGFTPDVPDLRTSLRPVDGWRQAAEELVVELVPSLQDTAPKGFWLSAGPCSLLHQRASGGLDQIPGDFSSRGPVYRLFQEPRYRGFQRVSNDSIVINHHGVEGTL